MENKGTEKNLNATEVAARFRVTAGTVMQWVRTGLVPAEFIDMSGPRMTFKPGAVACLEDAIKNRIRGRRGS